MRLCTSLKTQLKLKVEPMKEAWSTKITSKSEGSSKSDGLFLEVKHVGSFTVLLKSNISRAQKPFNFSLLGPSSILKFKSPSKIKSSYFSLFLPIPKEQSCSKSSSDMDGGVYAPDTSHLFPFKLTSMFIPSICLDSKSLFLSTAVSDLKYAATPLLFEYGQLSISDNCRPWIVRL